MWLCLFSGRRFKGTFEKAQWGKVKQMQPMWLCILSGRQFEDTFQNAQWRKVKQVQPMWLCIFSGRQFEDAFKNSQWRKVKKCNQCDFASVQAGDLRTHLKTHSGEKPNQRQALQGDIWRCTVEKSQANATSVTMHPLRHIWKHSCAETSDTHGKC